MWSANNNFRNMWPPNIPPNTANNQDWGSLAQQWASQKTNVQNWQNPLNMNDLRNGHPSLQFRNPQQYLTRQFEHQQCFDNNQDYQSSHFSLTNYQQESYNGSQHQFSLLGPQPGHSDFKNIESNKRGNVENEFIAPYANFNYDNFQDESLRDWNDSEEPPDLYNTKGETFNDAYDGNLNYQPTPDQELIDKNSSILQFQTNSYAPNTMNIQMHSQEQSNAFNNNFSQQTSYVQHPANIATPNQNVNQTDSMTNFLNLNNPNQFGAQSNMMWGPNPLPQANPLMFGIMPSIAGLSNPSLTPQFFGLSQNLIPNMQQQHKKTLPAWLKEGLEKMEKEKEKKRGSIDNTPTKDGEWPAYPGADTKNILEVEMEIAAPKKTPNKFIEQTPPSLKGEASPFPNYESQSENESDRMTPKIPPPQDLITNIKLLLTEVLMDSTSYLINKVAVEQMLIIQKEIQEKNLQKSRKALNKISSLGIAAYGSEGDSSQDEDDINLLPTATSSPHVEKTSISSIPISSDARLVKSRSGTPNVPCVMPNVISNNNEIGENYSNAGGDAAIPDNGAILKGEDKEKKEETRNLSPTLMIPLPLMSEQAVSKGKKAIKTPPIATRAKETPPNLKSHGFSLIEELNRNKIKASLASHGSSLAKASGKVDATSRSKQKDSNSSDSRAKNVAKVDKSKPTSSKLKSMEGLKGNHGSGRAKRSRSASLRKEGDKSRSKISKEAEKKTDTPKHIDNNRKNSISLKSTTEKGRPQHSDKDNKGEDKSSKVTKEKVKLTTEENQSTVKLSKISKVDPSDKSVKVKKHSATSTRKKEDRKKVSKKSKNHKKSSKKQKKKLHSSKHSDRKKKSKRDKKHKHSSHRRHKSTTTDSSSSDASESSSSSTEDSNSTSN